MKRLGEFDIDIKAKSLLDKYVACHGLRNAGKIIRRARRKLAELEIKMKGKDDEKT